MAAILKIDKKALLGRGGYGSVFCGTFNGREVAVKSVELNTSGDNEETLQKLNHENVVKLYHFEKDNDFKYFALELCAASLDQLFLPADDDRKYKGPKLPHHFKILSQLASGLAYIHGKKLIHRDIKPENVLISVDPAGKEQVTMKWADFGLSKSVNERGTYTLSQIKGTERWLAPELLKLINQNKMDEEIRGTVKSDVFAEGLVFGYFLLNGQHPFGSEKFSILINIINNSPIKMNGIHRSHYARELIDSMLTDKLDDRIKSEDVVTNLDSIKNELCEKEKNLFLFIQQEKTLNEFENLIQYGIDINVKDKDGATALHYLYANYWNENLPEIVKLFIESGIDINAKNNGGSTALHHLCRYYSKENLPEIVKLFIDGGIDINAKDNAGSTALHHLCRYYSKENLPEIVKLFIDGGIDINAKDNDRWTALHYLCWKYSKENLPEIVKLFIDGGIDINAKDNDGWTALHILCANYSKENLPEIVKLFIDGGIDINAKNNDGRTALHILCRDYSNENLLEIVKLFIEGGIDVICKNNDGHTALFYLASNYQHTNLTDIFKLIALKM